MIKADDLKNFVTSLNTGTDRLQRTFFQSTTFFTPAELAAIYSGWLGRRIVDLVPNEALKKGFSIKCPDWDEEKIKRLDSYCRKKLHLLPKLLTCLKAQRWAGGAIMVAITDSGCGRLSEKAPDFLPRNSLLGLQPFDAWQAVPSLIEFNNILSPFFRLPTAYSIGVASTAIQTKNGPTPEGALVDASRCVRFDGLEMPWYERQKNMYWGQSLLASAYDAIRNSGLVDNSIATLLFRASVPVFKVHDLATIVGDAESKAAFMERVNVMNYGMSNNNMAIIDAEETLESFEPGAISNLDGILERFYIIVSSATGIPVVKLVGESARGLNATGEGDLNNYYDLLEEYQANTVKPMLLDMFRRWIVPSFFDELMPDSFDIQFPVLERMSDKEKQERDAAFISMLRDAVDAGFIDREVAVKEIMSRKVFESFGQEDLDRMSRQTEEENKEMDAALDVADKETEQSMVIGAIENLALKRPRNADWLYGLAGDIRAGRRGMVASRLKSGGKLIALLPEDCASFLKRFAE